MVLYQTTNEGAVLRIDLGTGAVQRRHVPVEPRLAGPWMVLARQGGFAMADGSYDDQSPIYGVADGPDTPAVTLAAWSEPENNGTLAPAWRRRRNPTRCGCGTTRWTASR